MRVLPEPVASGLLTPVSGHVVYRVYDSSDRLIYVGVTQDLIARLGQHSTASAWYPLLSRVEWHSYVTREAAERVEQATIVDYVPKYNIVHNRDRIDQERELSAQAIAFARRLARGNRV